MPKKTLNPKTAFGLRIKELRFERSVTQEELAERSGMFRTYMSRVESGLANPTLTVIHTLAAALDVDIAELFVAPRGEIKRVISAKPVSRGRVSRT